MSNQRFSPEFKDEAVRQIVDRGYSVTEVSERLGVSAHSLFKRAMLLACSRLTSPSAARFLSIWSSSSLRSIINKMVGFSASAVRNSKSATLIMVGAVVE